MTEADLKKLPIHVEKVGGYYFLINASRDQAILITNFTGSVEPRSGLAAWISVEEQKALPTHVLAKLPDFVLLPGGIGLPFSTLPKLAIALPVTEFEKFFPVIKSMK